MQKCVLPVVKCLWKAGRGIGSCSQPSGVRVVRGLLQRLNQVVPILWIYRPQRAFTYALEGHKERRKEKRDVIIKASMLS